MIEVLMAVPIAGPQMSQMVQARVYTPSAGMAMIVTTVMV